MMTKEEGAAKVTYCQENKVSLKQRLAEVGIHEWSFYEVKVRRISLINKEAGAMTI